MAILCKIEGCDRNRGPKGMCWTHYQRERTGRDVLAPMKSAKGRALEWLFEHRDHSSPECLLWPFPKGKRRGQMLFNGKHSSPSRVMCIIANGEPVGERNLAAHECRGGELGCVNPKHLLWKTALENQRDRVRDGTDLRGEKQPRRKLSEKDVLEIKRLWLSGVKQRQIADMYSVNPVAISLIISGKRWKHLSGGGENQATC